MTGVTWLDALQAIGALATAVGVFLGWIQLKHQQKQLRTDFEDRLSQQYREAIANIPIEAMLGGTGVELDDSALTAFYRYFDLTNEQIFLKNGGRVAPETWENWADGIRMNMRRPAFVVAWAIIANRAPDSFEELRGLVPPPPHATDVDRTGASETPVVRRPAAEIVMPSDPAGRVIAIRKASNASWSNLRKAIAAISGLPHEPFGSTNVESTSKSVVRRMMRETALTVDQLSVIVEQLAVPEAGLHTRGATP
ncbi:MAG: hypothetical protein M3Q69_09845 [Acidobacteriota bacterium]|nr:hypothetical protein [Acidobacteriota bacterium]